MNVLGQAELDLPVGGIGLSMKRRQDGALPELFSSIASIRLLGIETTIGNLASFCQIKYEYYSTLLVGVPMNGLRIRLAANYRLLFLVSRTPIPAISSSLMKRIPAFSKAP
ncbi:MAG: hypothetical protein WA728_23700 [Xanthobacteraceae bacterium]